MSKFEPKVFSVDSIITARDFVITDRWTYFGSPFKAPLIANERKRSLKNSHGAPNSQTSLHARTPGNNKLGVDLGNGKSSEGGFA